MYKKIKCNCNCYYYLLLLLLLLLLVVLMSDYVDLIIKKREKETQNIIKYKKNKKRTIKKIKIKTILQINIMCALLLKNIYIAVKQ